MTDPAASRMTTPMTTSSASRIDFNTPALQRKRRLRALKDRLTNWYVLIGGVAVLATITLIFFYLAYVVLPLFRGAEMTALEPQSPAWVQAADRPLFMAIEEQNEIALRVSAQGEAVFFSVSSGAEIKRFQLPIPAERTLVSLQQGLPGSALLIAGLSGGEALVLRHSYKVSYPNDQKTVTPVIEYPYGQTPFTLDPQGRALEHVNVSVSGDALLLAASTGAELHLLKLSESENMMTGEITREEQRIALPQLQ